MVTIAQKETERLHENAVSHFGITDSPYEAGYLINLITEYDLKYGYSKDMPIPAIKSLESCKKQFQLMKFDFRKPKIARSEVPDGPTAEEIRKKNKSMYGSKDQEEIQKPDTLAEAVNKKLAGEDTIWIFDEAKISSSRKEAYSILFCRKCLNDISIISKSMASNKNINKYSTHSLEIMDIWIRLNKIMNDPRDLDIQRLLTFISRKYAEPRRFY